VALCALQVKLIVNMDKNLPTNVAELPPINLQVLEVPVEPTSPDVAAESGRKTLRRSITAVAAATASMIDDSRGGSTSPEPGASLEASPAPARGGSADGSPNERLRDNSKLKAAATEVMNGFGSPDERREKDALVFAVEAFATGSATESSYTMDRDRVTTPEAARRSPKAFSPDARLFSK
jgi:hypothetical protein